MLCTGLFLSLIFVGSALRVHHTSAQECALPVAYNGDASPAADLSTAANAGSYTRCECYFLGLTPSGDPSRHYSIREVCSLQDQLEIFQRMGAHFGRCNEPSTETQSVVTYSEYYDCMSIRGMISPKVFINPRGYLSPTTTTGWYTAAQEVLHSVKQNNLATGGACGAGQSVSETWQETCGTTTKCCYFALGPVKLSNAISPAACQSHAEGNSLCNVQTHSIIHYSGFHYCLCNVDPMPCSDPTAQHHLDDGTENPLYHWTGGSRNPDDLTRWSKLYHCR